MQESWRDEGARTGAPTRPASTLPGPVIPDLGFKHAFRGKVHHHQPVKALPRGFGSPLTAVCGDRHARGVPRGGWEHGLSRRVRRNTNFRTGGASSPSNFYHCSPTVRHVVPKHEHSWESQPGNSFEVPDRLACTRSCGAVVSTPTGSVLCRLSEKNRARVMARTRGVTPRHDIRTLLEGNTTQFQDFEEFCTFC
jgi:hypothetical protein